MTDDDLHQEYHNALYRLHTAVRAYLDGFGSPAAVVRARERADAAERAWFTREAKEDGR